MARPGTVTVSSSTPSSYGRILPHGEIYLDPVHAELIGAEYEIMGADDSELKDPVTDPRQWVSPERYQQWKELVGQEESEREAAYEETEEEGEEGPLEDEEGPIEGPSESEGGGESYAPGGFGGGYAGPPPVAAPPPGVPSYTPMSPPGSAPEQAQLRAVAQAVKSFRGLGGAFNKPPPAKKPTPAQTRAIARSVAKFRTNLVKGNPRTIAAFNVIRQSNPAFAASLGRRTGGLGFMVRGEVIMGDHAVSKTLASIVKTVLSPVAWGVHGVGTVSNEVGKTLNKLAGKL